MFKPAIPPYSVTTARRVARILFLSGLVGVVAGVGAIIFLWMLDFAKQYTLGAVAGYYQPGPSGEESLFSPLGNPFRRWLLLFIPAAGES